MALAGPLQKKAMIGLNPLHVLFFSNFAAFLFSVFIIFKTKTNVKFKLKSKTTPIAILYLLAQLAFSFAIHNENPVIVTSISRSYLVFNFLISFFILKETFNSQQVYATLIILVGIFGLSVLPADGVRWSVAAYLTVIYSLIFSVHNSLLKFDQNNSAVRLILFQNGLSGLIFSISLAYEPMSFLENRISILYACLAGFLSSFLGFILYRRGLEHLRFSEASSIRALSPIIGIAVVYPLYPVQLSPTQIVSIFFVLLGCLAFNLSRIPDEPA